MCGLDRSSGLDRDTAEMNSVSPQTYRHCHIDYDQLHTQVFQVASGDTIIRRGLRFKKNGRGKILSIKTTQGVQLTSAPLNPFDVPGW